MKLKPANIATSAIVAICLGSAFLFQNCSKIAVNDLKDDSKGDGQGVPDPGPGSGLQPGQPGIQITASPTNVVEGNRTVVTVTYQDVQNVTYMCQDRATQEILATGSIDQSGRSISVEITRDIHCEVSGHAVDTNALVQASQDVTVDCANRIKNTATNRCEDFTCKQVIELQLSDLSRPIPKRTSDGICYAVKMASAIANSQSSLTSTIDNDVLSRNHDSRSDDPTLTRIPYLMAGVQTDFSLEGPRVVRVAGGKDPDAKISVDNFMIYGIHPASQDISQSIGSVYKAMGTSDSSIADANGADTHAVRFQNVLLPVTPFATGGTALNPAVDLTRNVEPGVIQKLDFRAEDCGGHRELSDIYLLFR